MMIDIAGLSASKAAARQSLREQGPHRAWVVRLSPPSLRLAACANATAQNVHELDGGSRPRRQLSRLIGQDINAFDAALARFIRSGTGKLSGFTAIAELKPDCAMAHWGMP